MGVLTCTLGGSRWDYDVEAVDWVQPVTYQISLILYNDTQCTCVHVSYGRWV